MATPKGLQGVSTPKNPLTSTPNRPTASPRPNAGVFASKTLAYKSPAGKTPTSFHGHSHRVSISSHPTSTPLAAPAIHDELLNLNSPAAALIASIGNTALTPLATGQDGLGITTGVPPQSIGDTPLLTRNPETEKLDRLEQVAKLLKTRTAGRGITREGVEKVAQIQGFTILWDEENLTIAGNSVDLEIIFDSKERDTIRDVQLRLNASDSEEPQLQHKASELLKRHLGVSSESPSPTETWKSLQHFSNDLEYLSQLDYADSSANCFELMNGLFSTFRKIWDEERKRMRDRAEVNHVCQGNIGKPSLDGNDRLGVTSQYWVSRQNYQASIHTPEDSANSIGDSWIARFSCQKGNPGISSNSQWLEDEPLKTLVTTEDVFQEVQIERPNWSNIDGKMHNNEQPKDADEMMLDGAENNNTKTLDVTFTCRLDQAVLVPINVLNTLNGQYQTIEIDQRKALGYQQALLNESMSTSAREWNPSIRWSKEALSFDQTGMPSSQTHSYSLFANGIAWSYPVDSFKFSHPKQYADAVPILRQYALLWNILCNSLVKGGTIELLGSESAKTNGGVTQAKKSMTKQRNNKHLAQNTLETLLSSKPLDGQIVPIDLSLDLLTNPSKAKVEVIIPLPTGVGGNREGSFVQLVIEIGRNGLIEIPLINGLRSMDEDKTRRKATRVLGLSEDLAVLVEWLLSDMRRTG